MVAWTREVTYWWPVVAGLGLLAYYVLLGGSAHIAVAVAGLVDGRWIFPKIERLKGHGLDIVTATELAAEQHDIDPDELAVEHFAWQLETAHEREAA